MQQPTTSARRAARRAPRRYERDLTRGVLRDVVPAVKAARDSVDDCYAGVAFLAIAMMLDPARRTVDGLKDPRPRYAAFDVDALAAMSGCGVRTIQQRRRRLGDLGMWVRDRGSWTYGPALEAVVTRWFGRADRGDPDGWLHAYSTHDLWSTLVATAATAERLGERMSPHDGLTLIAVVLGARDDGLCDRTHSDIAELAGLDRGDVSASIANLGRWRAVEQGPQHYSSDPGDPAPLRLRRGVVLGALTRRDAADPTRALAARRKLCGDREEPQEPIAPAAPATGELFGRRRRQRLSRADWAARVRSAASQR